ncbi:SurA N-terminal domain-containing protein [Zwartia panacis]|uniref:SurA N-terminal domain-containing protein n=1 Tax=Zwartia panacis TaxID=2683345 RepID=UPI0025B5CB68|nr:SurA N-terminal domain-containing protein [Zwartia panacis]MDN4016867.1 SurA N-terminal domain-containing protein [Zwartia panacis]
MFDFIRSHQRWMQLILLLLIVPSFVFFGVQGYSSFMASEPELVSVGDQPITLGQFNQARTAQLEQYRNALGSQFDPAAFDTPEFREQLLNRMIDERTVALAAAKGRYSVSDETLRRTIAAIPAVQENGQFSSQRYRDVLAAQGMTPTTFELGLRRDLAIAQVLQPIGLTARVPAEVSENILALLTEKRTVERRVFSATDFSKSIDVTEADIKKWYDSNQSKLLIPENVDVQFIVLNEQAASKNVKVTEENIESFYKQNQARYGQPERRRVSHILIELPASANDAVKAEARAKAEDLAKKAAAAPQSFASLAKDFSQDTGSANQGGDLGWITKNMLVPQVENAVFDLERGKISGVVESPFGYHIINVVDIQPASVKSLAEVKEDITNEIRKQLAAEQFAQLGSKLTSLVYDQRDSLSPIATALNLPIRSASGLTRDGLLPASQRSGPELPEDEQTILGNPKVRQAVFSSDVLKEKLNSGVIEVSPDVIVAIRVSAIHPAHVPALAAVSQQIKQRLTDELSLAAAQAAGQKELDLLKAKPDSEVKDFEPAVEVTRQQPSSLTREQLEAAMSASPQPLPSFVGVAGADQYTILKVSKIEPGAKPEATQLNQLQAQLSQAWGAAEEQAALKVLRNEFKVKLLPDANKLISGELDAAKL